jgi:predicted sugar kinase
LPETWRFVLTCPSPSSGPSGADEIAAFARLPPVPTELTAQLCREALLEMLPAAATADFTRFSRSLYRFGRMAGGCFATQQAGVYATEEAAWLVEQIRRRGIEGVGQSSWGPTLFALTASEADARSLAESLEQPGREITIARPLNCGANVNFVA